MPRPKGNAERKLIDAAREIAREDGFARLSIRGLCRRAKVNTGLFHDHFKSRRAFVERVMEETYADFFARLSVPAAGPGAAPVRLRQTLRAIAGFARDHRRLFVSMLNDGLSGDEQTARFVSSHFPRHIPILLGLVEEGRRSGDFRALSPGMTMSFMLGALSTPNVAFTLLELHGAKRPFGQPIAAVERQLLSDEAIELRIDMVMAGLARPGKRR